MNWTKLPDWSSVMATKLTDYIKTYDNILDESVCKSIIESFSKSDSVYVDREQRPSFRELNISKKYEDKDPLWMDHQETILNALDGVVDKYISQLKVGPDFPAKYAYEEFRMKMYQNNGHDQFKDHVDVQDHESARRFLVMFIYLNTVNVGGHTEFPIFNHQVASKCGRILLFPATWQYRHAGRSPISSEKYIVGSYLHYL